MSKIFIHLHTFDLRLHDSPSLHISHQPNNPSTHFLPIYIFDPRQLDLSLLPNSPSSPSSQGTSLQKEQEPESEKDLPSNPNHVSGNGDEPNKTRASPKSRVAGFHRTSPYRLLFLLQAVYELREGYRRSGGDMLIGYGKPEELLPSLIASLQKHDSIEGVWAQEEYTVEEVGVLRRLKSKLHDQNVKLHLNDSKTLIPSKHLPFDPKTSTPDIYTMFRKKVEGMGLYLDGGMFVEPLQTAKWEEKQGNKVSEIVVSVGEQGAKLKPFPKLDLESVKIEKGRGGWISKDEKYDSLEGMYAALVKPILASPPIGGWSTALPSSTKDNHAVPSLHDKSAIPFGGGESAGLARLSNYVGYPEGNGDKWAGGEKAKKYKTTRNGLLGEGFSTKFSMWFSLGSLSARQTGWRVGQLMERVERDKDAYGNVYWISFELLWRDFFQWTTLKYSLANGKKSKGPLDRLHPNSTLFNATGYSSQVSLYPADQRPNPSEWHSPNWSDVDDPARKWCEGRTGVPFIDANMRELRETGWMSNRGRQNVASFLVKDLYVDWRIGAEFFEMHLVDYDTCSNWGNWQYQAGVGNDARSSRQFNPIKQAGDYDPSNEFVRLWCPELKDVPDQYVQTPWVYGDKSKLGAYPHKPVVETQSWKKFYPGNAKGGRNGRGGGGGGGGGRGGHGGNGGRGERGGRGGRNGGSGGGPKGGLRD